jgi:hypothetical protein
MSLVNKQTKTTVVEDMEMGQNFTISRGKTLPKKKMEEL